MFRFMAAVLYRVRKLEEFHILKSRSLRISAIVSKLSWEKCVYSR